jgi:hypothetical protein
LKHKAGPIQFQLGPRASKQQISAESAKLQGILVQALRPYVGRVSHTPPPPNFEEIRSTQNIAFFWEPHDILVRVEDRTPLPFRREDRPSYEYRFDERRAFYLRLIPTKPRTDEVRLTTLTEIAESRRVDVLTRGAYGTNAGRNQFGAISYEAHGDNMTPSAFTQLFRNGEIWGVTRELFAEYQGSSVIPMISVLNFYQRVINNYVEIAHDLGGTPPYVIELGAVGLRGMRVSLPSPNPWNEVSSPIYESELRIRKVLNDPSFTNQRALIDALLADLNDLADVRM